LIIPSSLALLDESHAKFRGSVLLGVGVNVESGDLGITGEGKFWGVVDNRGNNP
jgi:hypothetical protein